MGFRIKSAISNSIFIIFLFSLSFLLPEELLAKNKKKGGSCKEAVVNNEQFDNLEKHIVALESRMSIFEGDFEKLIEGASSLNIRSHLFRVEYTLKLFSEHPSVKKKQAARFLSIRDFVKAFENALGQYDLKNNLLKAFRKGGKENSSLEDSLSIELAAARDALQGIVEPGGWLNVSEEGSAYAELRSELLKISWKKIDRKYALKALISEIQKLDEEIEQELRPLIMQENYDYNALENGFHRFRRNLRKVSLYMSSVGDYFAFAPAGNNLNQEDELLIEKFTDNKYTVLNPARKDSILIDPVSYYKIAYLVYQIGKVKDRGEMIFYIGNQLAKKAGEKRSVEQLEAEAEMILYGEIRVNDESIEERGHRLYSYFDKHQPLKAIRMRLEKARKQ